MAYLVGMVNTIITPFYNIVFKHVMYPFTASRNVKNLKEATQGLIAKSSDVRYQIEISERTGMTAKNEVQRWLENVDTIRSDEEAISQMYDQRSKVFGCFSLNCWSNYKISKSADKKLLKAQEYAKIETTVVAIQPLPPSVREMPIPSNGLLSEELNIQEALRCIRNSPVGIIGIWGLGGVGKTHLLKKINNSFVGDSFFDVVIFVTASKDCSVEKIQAEIVKKLNLRKDDDVESQANIISDFLRKKSFLVLLDDLWEQLDLQATGVPYPLGFVGQLKRKVVLTTRSRVVCGAMMVRKEIKVDCLREDEALQLFQENVGQDILFSNHRIGTLAKDLVKELKGLPLAIIATGKAMYPKKDPGEWESAIHLLRRSGHDVDDPTSMENTIFLKLKLSYDSLGNDTMRRCFLICSLWPEDSPIAKDELIQCWMGLGLLNKCDIQSSYNEGYNLIGHLQATSLLEATEDSSQHVKMHDVIRDMAIWISCGCGENNNKWIVHAAIGKTVSRKCIPWNRVEFLSLMGNELEELPSLGGGVNQNSLGSVRSKCWLGTCSSELRVLLLQDNKLNEKALGNIYLFTALTYLDLSQNRIGVIPTALCALADLEYLDLSYNHISELPKHLQHLIKLKFLYLKGNHIHTIPKGIISRLEALQVLDLLSSQISAPVNYTPLFQELDILTNLKYVGIGIKGDAAYELLRKFPSLPIRYIHLSKLIETPSFCFLDGCFSSSSVQMSLHDLTIRKCSMEQIMIIKSMEGTNCHFDILDSLTFDRLRNLKGIIWNGVAPESLFPRLTYLAIIHCHKLKHISWAMYLPCLQRIVVNGCDNMNQIVRRAKSNDVESEYGGQESPKTSLDTFPCLRYFELQSLPVLLSICDPDVTFPSLETMEISFCPKLKRLPFLMQSMPMKLHNISIPLVQMKWWERLEWIDEGVKRAIQPLVNSDLSHCSEQNLIYL